MVTFSICRKESQVRSTNDRIFSLGLALAGFVICTGPVSADELQGSEYLSRRDTISLSAGNAKASNLAIQTPTPWPYHVYNYHIPGNGHRSVNIMEHYYSGPDYQAQGPTVINPRFNISVPPQ